MKEKEITNILISTLSGIEKTEVRSSMDFEEKRPSENMIVVSLDGKSIVNVGLPDFKYDYSVIVDSYIKDDLNGEGFMKIYGEVYNRLMKCAEREYDLKQTFGDIPIVGFFIDGQDFVLTETSNRCIIKFHLISSFTY